MRERKQTLYHTAAVFYMEKSSCPKTMEFSFPPSAYGQRGSNIMILQEAGIPRLVAPTIGIAVDFRRQNLSEESLTVNVARLKAYKERLIVFPRKGAKHPKAGDSKDIDLSSTQTISNIGAALPIIPVGSGVTEIKKSDMPAAIEGGAFKALRKARSDARLVGAREKRAKDKAEAEANKK